MGPNEIRDIEDWDARSRAAGRALTSVLKSEAPDVPLALDLVDIIARLALAFAGDDQGPKASRLRARCDRTLRDLERLAPPDCAERIGLMRLRVTRETRSVDELRNLVSGLRARLELWSAPGLAVLDAIDAHCQWEGREREVSRVSMADAANRLVAHYREEPAEWLPDYAWACGRLAYWFDLAELRDEELEWRDRAIEALSQQLLHTQSVRGLLGILEEKQGRLLMQRGDYERAGVLLESALDHVSHWDDASRHVRAALKKLRKKKMRA